MKRPFILCINVILLCLLLSACNFPMLNPAEPNPGLIYTAAAETAVANATLLSQPRPTITFITTLQPTTTQLPEPQFTASPTNSGGGTPAPSRTSTLPGGQQTCDKARFVRDITIPDGTVFSPEERFTKTWLLENTGTCTWTPGYTLVFVEGDRMSAPVELKLTDQDVNPGEEIEVSVNLIAPVDTGTYQADFQIRNANGQIFGLGDEGDKTFWVRVQVAVPGGISFDMIARASSGDWSADIGTNNVNLIFNDNPDSLNGYAGIADAILQEDGRESAKILITFPPESGGSIYGEYPPYTVQSGDRFLGRIGFLAKADGNCGPGAAIFRLLVQVGGESRELGEWQKRCDGRLLPVSVDLSGLRGDTVAFVLEVDSDGSADGDQVFWSSIRVER